MLLAWSAPWFKCRKTAAAFFHNQQEALESGKDGEAKSNSGLYFNIGLAESKLDHPASAIYAFERHFVSVHSTRPILKPWRLKKKDGQPVIPLHFRNVGTWAGSLYYVREFGPCWFVIITISLLFYLVTIKAFLKKQDDNSSSRLGLMGCFFATSLLSASFFQERWRHHPEILWIGSRHLQ
jgi:hypothetical protein